jgi:hypothetical protein
MKAIFTGTIAGGFGIKAVVQDDNSAEDMVIALLANGELAEAMNVQDPATLNHPYQKDDSGSYFVVYGKSLGNGFEVFGPFADQDTAEECGEDNRGEDDEWELFQFVTSETPELKSHEYFVGHVTFDDGNRIDVEFLAPAGASKQEKDAAFVDALAQVAEVNYLATGKGASNGN